MRRKKALETYLGTSVTPVAGDAHMFACGAREYLVLAEREALRRAEAYIADTLWAFRPEFLRPFLSVDVDLSPLQAQYERANPIIRALVGRRFKALVREAIAADSLGHFLAPYDGLGAFTGVDGRWLVFRQS